MDIRSQVGRQIRALREEAGLSQDALASAAGLSRVFVGSIERGEHAATVDTLGKLARALAVEPHELLSAARVGAGLRPERSMRRIQALLGQASGREAQRLERILTAVARAFLDRR